MRSMLVSFRRLKRGRGTSLRFDENTLRHWLGADFIRERSASESYLPTVISVPSVAYGILSCLTPPISCRMQNQRVNL